MDDSDVVKVRAQLGDRNRTKAETVNGDGQISGSDNRACLKPTDQRLRFADGASEIRLRPPSRFSPCDQPHSGQSSHHLNYESTLRVHNARNDRSFMSPHDVDVAESLDPDWHLQEWAALLGKRQADLVNDLGFAKNQAHRVWHGKQPYRRDIVNLVANWLNLKPYELLMRPEEAMRLRRLEETAVAIVADRDRSFSPAAPEQR